MHSHCHNSAIVSSEFQIKGGIEDNSETIFSSPELKGTGELIG